MNVRAPLRHVAFRWLVAGRFVSMLGTAIAPVALAFAVLDLTGSASDLGVVLAARTVPLVLCVLFAGVVADRFPRHHVLLASNLVSGGTQALVATLLLTHHASVGTLVAIEVVGGASNAFLWPSLQGLTPQTVSRDVLQPANALLRLATNAATIGGSAVAGLLVATAGPGWGLAVDAVTFFLGALCLSRIRLPRGDRAPASNVLAELRVGWTEFVSRTWVWVVVVTFGFVNMVVSGTFGVLGPVIADDTVGRPAWGLVLAGQTVGMVVGGLLTLRLRPRRPLLVGTAAIGAEVPFFLLLAEHPTVPLLVLAGVAGGIGIETFGVYWDLSLQQHVPDDRLSRVASYDALGSFVMTPVGQVLAGPAAVLLGLTDAVLLAGAVLLACVVVATVNPSVRRLERTDEALAPEPADDLVVQ